tara:strand:+ start:2117 stop:2539 length:423 start_codon:yes stop_codon:yes gene_type:complete
MRDLSNPLAPTFPTKEDRIRKKIKKKEEKKKKLTPKSGGNNKPKGKANTPNFSLVNTIQSQASKQKKCKTTTGSCAKGNKKAYKTQVKKGTPFRRKGSTKTVGTLKQRKKLQKDIDKLNVKLNKSKKGSPTKKHSNPRFL